MSHNIWQYSAHEYIWHNSHQTFWLLISWSGRHLHLIPAKGWRWFMSTLVTLPLCVLIQAILFFVLDARSAVWEHVSACERFLRKIVGCRVSLPWRPKTRRPYLTTWEWESTISPSPKSLTAPLKTIPPTEQANSKRSLTECWSEFKIDFQA